MKEPLPTKNTAAFSIVEILIAMALMATIITVALQANASLQYWRITTAVGHQALYTAKGMSEYFSAVIALDFFAASSSQSWLDLNGSMPCLPGNVCYLLKSEILDISPCVKDVTTVVSWKVQEAFPTSSVELHSQYVHTEEMIARGGDCLLAAPAGSWNTTDMRMQSNSTNSALFTTGIDIFDAYIFVTASSSPHLRVYQLPASSEDAPLFISSATGTSRINSLDVVRDMSTGRMYAYVMLHSNTNQLGVFDVTNPQQLEWVTAVPLYGVPSTGSFPQGWRVMAYSNRLYVVTRETAGSEFHIFDISNPRQPQEIISAAYNLGRTVNDLVVREQNVNGSLRRYLFLAASASQNELEVFDVTDDVLIPVYIVDLPGTEDASSLCLQGNSLYLGRKNASGPELYRIVVPSLLQQSFLAEMSEVGADILSLGCSGNNLFLGTNRVGAQFQVWESHPEYWSTSTVNAGRIGVTSIPRLAPLGLAMSEDFVFLISQSNTQPEVIRSLYSL